MWTLFDPLVRPVQSEPEREDALKRALALGHKKAPSTLERLWQLFEPTGPLSSRLNAPTHKTN
ncbi:MAG: hypothetical protein Q7N50_14955 [Armatimonadota bacterium]|nr:hypothetical protein [Armatimonadota bacterium]